MGKLLNTNEFIKKSKLIFGDLYTYDETIYINSKKKVIITCKIHNNFEITPSNHYKKIGCKKCSSEIKSQNMRSNTKDFIKKAKLKHNNKYDYSLTNYIKNYYDIKIICRIHGVFKQKPQNHLAGRGCHKCKSETLSTFFKSSTEDFIKKAIKIHGNKYNYSKTLYGKNEKDKVNIICKLHGIFSQKPGNHLNGATCRKCCYLYNNYNKSDWLNKAKNKESVFYILKCWNDKEEFYKFGITMRSVKLRYQKDSDMPYKYEKIREIKSYNNEYIWNLEKRFKKFKIKNHYNPLIFFPGSKTECFKN